MPMTTLISQFPCTKSIKCEGGNLCNYPANKTDLSFPWNTKSCRVPSKPHTCLTDPYRDNVLFIDTKTQTSSSTYLESMEIEKEKDFWMSSFENLISSKQFSVLDSFQIVWMTLLKLSAIHWTWTTTCDVNKLLRPVKLFSWHFSNTLKISLLFCQNGNLILINIG